MRITWPVSVSLSALLLFQVCALFARAYVEFGLIRDGFDSTYASHLSYLAVPAVLAVLMQPMLQANREYLSSLFRREALSLQLIMISVAIALCARIAWWAQTFARAALGVLSSGDTAAPVGPVISFGCPPLEWLLLGLLAMAVLAPIVEEVVHRGLLLGALLGRGSRAAILVSAAVFAAYHPDSLASIMIAFAMGIVLALQFTATRALWASVLTHASYNGIMQFDWRCVRIVWTPSARALPDVFAAAAACAAFALALALLIALLMKLTDDVSEPRRPPR